MTTTDDLRHLTLESRARLAAMPDLREQNRLIVLHSSRRLDASRLLLAQHALAQRVEPAPTPCV